MIFEFIFERAPFASAHASTIAETPAGLVAAWFGGPGEGDPEVAIWLARRPGGAWSAPLQVADGAHRGRRHPCWNPVLHQTRAGPLLLFYRVGPSPRRWRSFLARSTDHGLTWSPPERLPRGFLGPIKNKPLELEDGALLCPSSTEGLAWRAHLERTGDQGATWQRRGTLNARSRFGAIQPCLLLWPDGRLQALCRTRQRVIAEAWSTDGGASWSRMRATALPNPDSGIDAVMLQDGRALLVYNHASGGRTPLNLALSGDGRSWRAAGVLEEGQGEYSYPAVIQGSDGRVHVTYTWNRRHIRHVALQPCELWEP
ncbi:MAG: sialidase family protein [Geminicoccaceae bacterium]